ncbi:bile acid:sodium symporter family protein [Litoreibacter roseus]|uniref:Transporter n=1 Tax=Litoreibacter roseus TaxID=2601869 RepID=A0A6N6JLD6_9RHOB|nr:bile acid:sodium symporter family protein [Litoreibacter roseus]GFE66088.1 transporter [Litoreibacter roseus]
MDLLISVFLPISLAIIMFSLGLGLTVADFVRVFRQGRALIAGLCAQVILLPVVAFGFVKAFGLSGELAFGVMILSVCPGGVTSNMLTKLAGGTLALSISLTGLISLLSVVTVPALVVFWASVFLDEGALSVSITGLALVMFAITAVPVMLGMVFRKLAPALADRIERSVSALAALLFVLVVIGALAASWDVLMDNLATLGGITCAMVVSLLALGWIVAKGLGLPPRDRAAISIETGIQNSTLGITLAGLLTGGAEVLPAIALPAAIYGVLMYLGALPAVFAMRYRLKGVA